MNGCVVRPTSAPKRTHTHTQRSDTVRRHGVSLKSIVHASHSTLELGVPSGIGWCVCVFACCSCHVMSRRDQTFGVAFTLAH